MAFGTIKVVPMATGRKPKSPRVKPEKPVERPTVAGMAATAGALHINVAILAESCMEASDYLCGMYFNTGMALAGGSNACYTQNYATICRLAELKQELEEQIMRPVGSEIIRREPQDGETLFNCVLSMGQPGKQGDCTEVEFRWAATAAAASGADIAVVPINLSDNTEEMKKLAAGLSCPVVWVVYGFEQKALFWADDDRPAVEPTVLRQLLQMAAISGKRTDVLSFAQLYGGLQFQNRREDGTVTFATWHKCREYVPVGCHVGLLAVLLAVLNRQEQLSPAMRNLKQDLNRILTIWSPWYTDCGSEEGSTL